MDIMWNYGLGSLKFTYCFHTQRRTKPESPCLKKCTIVKYNILLSDLIRGIYFLQTFTLLSSQTIIASYTTTIYELQKAILLKSHGLVRARNK